MKKLISIVMVFIMIFAVVACAGDPTPAAEPAAPAVDDTPAETATDEGAEPAAPANGDEGLATSGEILRVAVQSQQVSWIIQYILDRGWDVEAGIPVELVVFPGGAPINEAMAAGEWDVAITGGAAIFGIANFYGRLLGHHMDGSGNNSIMARIGDEAFNVQGYNPAYPDVFGCPETVRGRTVLTVAGTSAHYAMLGWLRILGLTSADVEMVSTDFAGIIAAFRAGEGDFASMTDNRVLLGAADEGWAEVATLRGMNLPLLESVVSTSSAYYNRFNDLVAFMELVYRANDELLQSEELQVEYLKKWFEANAMDTDLDFYQIIPARPLVSSDMARAMDLHDFILAYAEFFIAIEMLEPDRYEVIRANVATDVLDAALANLR